MTHHLPNCHHKDGQHLIKKPDGEIIATCRCICTCPKDNLPSSTEWEKEFDKQFTVHFSNRGVVFPCVHTHADAFTKPESIKTFIQSLLSTSIKNREREIRENIEARLDQLSLCVGDEWNEGDRYAAVTRAKADLLASLSQEDEK